MRTVTPLKNICFKLAVFPVRRALLMAAAVYALDLCAAVYYVNDNSTANDVFCSEPGDDANDGQTPQSPVASLNKILTLYYLKPGDIVSIDAGTYNLTANIIINSNHYGVSGQYVTIRGAGRATVFNRQSQAAGDCCIDNRANWLRFQNLTFTNANTGLRIAADTCRNTEIIELVFCGHDGAALEITSQNTSTVAGTYTVCRNLIYNALHGVVKSKPATAQPDDIVKVANNTISVTDGAAIVMNSGSDFFECYNNILVTDGGSCYETCSTNLNLALNANNLWPRNGGQIAKMTWGGTVITVADLADWQRMLWDRLGLQAEPRSFSRDPAFADPAQNDYGLKSFGGRWRSFSPAETNGEWIADQDQHSPSVDAGHPDYNDRLTYEPQPNGGRVNMGAYGGTMRASKAHTNRFLLAMAPDYGQEPQKYQMILWNATGQGWTGGDNLKIQYSVDGGTAWENVSSSVPYSYGTHQWYRPSAAFAAAGCMIRVMSLTDPSVQDTVWLPNRGGLIGDPEPAVYYVNDTLSTYDVFCTAAGSDANDGLSAATPMATLQALLNRYNPGRGSTVYVDAGTYALGIDIVLAHNGEPGSPSEGWLHLIGADGKTVLDRQAAGAASSCIEIWQDFTRIEGFTFRGAESGVTVCPQSCRNAEILRNTFTANSGNGLTVLPDSTSEGYDTYVIRNNLFYNNGNGMDLQGGQGFRLAFFTVENNTVVGYKGYGIHCAGRPDGTTLKNNIISMKNYGYCLSLAELAVLEAADYNCLHVYGDSGIAVWPENGITRKAANLSDWQAASGFDAASIALDPLFVYAGTGNFHLRSAAGSWRGYTWYPDPATSPCVDAGDPSMPFADEPSPNGGRVNLGAYGNTAEASKSPSARLLKLAYPIGGETVTNRTLTISWIAAGTGWQAEDSARIEVCSQSNTAWTILSGADNLAPGASFTWQIPNPRTPKETYSLRVVCNQDSALYDQTKSDIVVLRRSVNYYVNDGVIEGDLYCAAPGLSGNSGTSPDSPLDSLVTLFYNNNITLGPGDTVYVDTGDYVRQQGAVMTQLKHSGAPDNPVRIIGTYGGSRLRNSSTYTNSGALVINANDVRVEGLTCYGSSIGIAVNASTARRVTLAGNIVYDNASCGIKIAPGGGGQGEEYQILQNVVVNNRGDALFLQGSPYTYSLTTFIVENNTIRNPGGNGIRIFNQNYYKKRTNFLKNNIVIPTNAAAACIVAYDKSLHYSDYNNLYHAGEGPVGALYATGQQDPYLFYTLPEWRARNNQDHNSISAPVSFADENNPAGHGFRLQPGSAGVDAGIISFWMFDDKDPAGTPRIVGQSVDIGAYELALRASVRCFLQGPFISGSDSMSNTLHNSGAIPLRSPYADDPRAVTALPADIVDWVLLQFRLSTNSPAVFSRSLFLRSDGWLVNDKGSPELNVDLHTTTNFYVSVKHRNHVAAMSAAPAAFDGQTMLADFTASPDAYFGNPEIACVAVNGADGERWALRAGDADGDGFVRPVDLEILDTQTNQTGYLRGDLNLDNFVNGYDSILLLSNQNARAAMPFPETPLLPALRVTPSRKTVDAGETVTLLGSVSGSAATDTAYASAYPYPYGYGNNTALPPDAVPINWSFAARGSGDEADIESFGGDQAVYTAGMQTGTNDIIEAWDSSGALGRAIMNVVGDETAESAGKAVIIAGRTSSQDTLWPATDYLANTAYNTLLYRGFSKENLHYLSPDPDRDIDNNGLLDDIDGASTNAAAAYVFTNEVSGCERLFVYLVDHGGNSSGNGYFRLNGSETVTADQLDTWLDALQDASQTHVTVLLDFCYAGSFLPELTYYGTAERIVVAACGDNQPSYFVAGGLVSFSSAFLSGVMLGYDIMQSFTMAQSAMSSYQAALLDDDKDGEYTTNDYLRATGAYIGPSYISGGDAPQIGEVCGDQILTDQTSAMLWIGSVESLHPVSNAWCLIIPPDHDPDPENPVTDLPRLDLTYDSSSGRYTVTYDGFTAPGTFNVTFYVQDVEGNISAPRYSYVSQIGYDDRVILVAGGDTNSAVWPAIENLAQLAYNTMRLRLFPADHIHVLTPSGCADYNGDSTNDVAAATTLASLQHAFNDWATSNSTDRLTVYMIGEGSGNNFRLNDSELLTTNQFEGLVSGFQWQNPIPVNIILDFSGSGAFIPCLADQYLADEYPSATRVSVASAGSGREALFANNGTVSFSQYLLAGIINGETLGDAYTAARRAIRRVSGSTRQRAELDDTLNGMSNEKNVDRLLADETHVGCSFVTGADMPVIGNVMPAAVLAAPGEPITLWASEVAGMYPVSNVWCTVTPPGYSGTGDLPVIELHWNSTTLRYEADSEAFILPGSYGLTFYARDTAGEISAPVQSEVILADAFEPDDTDSQASLYHGLPQIHTFHTSNDVDWARFYLVTNLVYYDIETFHLSDRLDTVIDLYRQLPDGSLEMLIDGHVDYEGSDLGEYTGIDVTESGWYWARISAYAAGDDTIGTYEFSVYTTAADGLNSLIILGIDDVYSSALPEDSTATVEGYGEIEFDGSVFVVCSGLTSGTYLVTVPVPENFMPREDPDTPDQIASLTNLFYANPRLVTVEGGWAMAGFEMLSTLAVTSGVVRDAWTGAFLADAQIAFTGASGNLTGTVADGSVILTSYRDQWQTAPGGSLPEDITLGACDWHLALALKGYHTNTLLYAVSNAPAGSQIDLGTVLLEPLDTNENGVADAWEDLHFPGGLDPDADSDDDGISNKDEYFCGTDPNDPDSVLRFLSAEPTAGDIDLSWSVAGGRNYEVLAVTSLTDTAVIATNGPWQAAHGQEQMQWTDTVAPLHKTRFYRLRLNQF